MQQKSIEQKKGHTSVGTLKTTASGVGFVVIEGRDEDIRVEESFLNTGLNNDTVEVTTDEPYKITKIVTRNKITFVGILEKESGINYLVTDDQKMYRDIRIKDNNLNEGKTGQKVAVEITLWNNSEKDPEGKVVRVLGKPGDNTVEMYSILIDKNLSIEFPPHVENEVKKISHEILQDEIEKRRDFRNILTFTIDPHDAKDFDDAISFQKLSNGNYEIGIHIADVSHYVRPKTALDNEAVKRATSVYLVDRTIPMLPEALSNDLCSLNPHTDKLTFSAVFEMDDDAQVKSEWFGRTIIHSDRRYTYEEAQEQIVKGKGEHAEELTTLNNIAKRLQKRKFAEGAISFEDSEVKFRLDENGKVLEIYKTDRFDAHKLVEEFMLLANRKVAKCVSELIKRSNVTKPFIYRVHDEPNQEKLHRIIDMMVNLGYDTGPAKKKYTSSDINAILKSVEGKPEEDLIQTAMVRSMSKAVYSTKNIGHFGLSFSHYTHFTSPIRRYPDVLVHRLLDLYLRGKTVSDDEVDIYDRLATYSSSREKVAAEAERDSIKLKQAEYMLEHKNDPWDGVISGVTRWGIYVQDSKTKSEGLIRLSALGNDFYEYNEEKMSVIGQKTKIAFRLGDKIKVKIKSVDVKKKQIDLVPLQASK